MDVYEAVLKRRSVRKYKSDPIPQEILEKVLEAGRLAPSAKNFQPWRFVVVTDKSIKEQLVYACCNQQFVAEAPVVIAGVGVNPLYVMRCGIVAQIVDVSIALTQMVLGATSDGLGTCFIGAFDQEEVKRILNIPDEYIVIEILTMGYPDEEPQARPRLELDEIAFLNKWGKQ